MGSACITFFLPGLLWKLMIKFVSEMQSYHGNGKGADTPCFFSTNKDIRSHSKLPKFEMGKEFCFFFMVKYNFINLLSGCMSPACSAVISDHRCQEFFLQVKKHPQEHVHILPDCSLLLLTRTILEATWWCWILQVQHILCSRTQS